MSDTNISINPDDAAAAVNLIAKNREQAGDIRPQLSAQGVGVGAAFDFKSSLDAYVKDLKTGIREIQANLLLLHENVTQTVTELGERDAELAAQTQSFLAGVEEIPAPGNAGTPGTPGTPGGPEKSVPAPPSVTGVV